MASITRLGLLCLPIDGNSRLAKPNAGASLLIWVMNHLITDVCFPILTTAISLPGSSGAALPLSLSSLDFVCLFFTRHPLHPSPSFRSAIWNVQILFFSYTQFFAIFCPRSDSMVLFAFLNIWRLDYVGSLNANTNLPGWEVQIGPKILLWKWLDLEKMNMISVCTKTIAQKSGLWQLDNFAPETTRRPVIYSRLHHFLGCPEVFQADFDCKSLVCERTLTNSLLLSPPFTTLS